MEQKILIIDGNSIVNQAYFATKNANMTNKDGVPTNAVYGFVNMMLKFRADINPTHIAVAFDMKGPTFRHQQYDQYKAGRKPMADDLRVQIPILKNMLDAMGIYRMELSGFEADDLLGTCARLCEEDGWEVVIVTGDQDALQLVTERTSVFLKSSRKEVLYTPQRVKEDYGVFAQHIIDLKGLAGDSSDNIPGIPNVGSKIAVALLNLYATVEEVIEHSEEIANTNIRGKKRIQGLVQEYADQAMMSKKLATIHRFVPIDWDPNEVKITPPDVNELLNMIQEYQFHSLIKRIPELNVNLDNIQGADDTPLEYTVLNTIEEIDGLCHKIKKVKNCVIYTIYDNVDVIKNELISMSIVVDKEYYYIPINTDTGKQKTLIEMATIEEADIHIEEKINALRCFLEDDKILKTTYEYKKDALLFRRYGIDLKGVDFDALIAMYLIEPARKGYDISDIAMSKVSVSLPSEEQMLGKGKKKTLWADVPQKELERYMILAVKSTALLKDVLQKQLDDMKLNNLYQHLELPLAPILADIEFEGFSVDTTVLNELDKEITGKIAELTVDIYDMAGMDFNINSPKQLGEVLFEKLELPIIKKTKTGFSTNHDVLMKLMNKHPIISLIIEYRQYTKLKSTYIDGLYAVINKTTGKIHTSLNQTVTATGRLSSKEPNLQNIPVRLPLGRQLRKVFVASSGRKLLDADYSQIELRILAELSGDEHLIHAFNNDVDIHTLTASQVFHRNIDEVSLLERSRAKEVNFGIVYGMSDYGLSENLHISRKEASEYIQAYFKTYPNVKKYMEEQIEFCKQHGFVTTVFERRRYIPEINHKNYNIRSFGERMAMNTPIQGSAADIIKMAMVKVYHALKDGNYKSKLILQVHDELIIDVVPDEMEEVQQLLRENMEHAIRGFIKNEFAVPLKVDMKAGDSWYDTK